MTNSLSTIAATITTPNATGIMEKAPDVSDMFFTAAGFELAQRMATALSKMAVLPPAYHDNIPNCMMVLNLAHAFRQYGVSPFMVAQQLVPVNGKFGWQGQFVIAVINASKRFAEELSFVFSGTEGTDEWGCEAVTKRHDGKEVRGTKITIKMAKEEGWYGKTGSKWKTMPQQMLMYRSGAFFGRAFAGDILMGMMTVEELQDMTMKDVTPTGPDSGDELTAMLEAEIAAAEQTKPAEVAKVEEKPSVAFELKPGQKLSDIGKPRKDSVVDDVDDR